MKIFSSLFDFVKNQPVRAFALLCVAITSAYVMVMGWRQNEILSSPDWCNRALNADKIAEGSRFDALQACVGMLTIQIKAIANGSYINGGTIALCLMALIVIVVAGGHLSFNSPLGSANMGGNPVKDAAQAVADEAQDAADKVKAAVTPIYTGPDLSAVPKSDAPDEVPWR